MQSELRDTSGPFGHRHPVDGCPGQTAVSWNSSRDRREKYFRAYQKYSSNSGAIPAWPAATTQLNPYARRCGTRPTTSHCTNTLAIRFWAWAATKTPNGRFAKRLRLAPDNHRLKLGLARTFYQQGKATQALVIVEDLLKASDTPAAAHVLHARLLLNAGDAERAVREYRLRNRSRSRCRRSGFGRPTGNRQRRSDERSSRGAAFAPRGKRNRREPIRPSNVPRSASATSGGMDALKDEIRMKIIHPLTHPELYAAYGKSVGGGILMYGPPGCGKTYLARATAGEVHAGFMAVGINDVLDMWIGSSERNLHEVFEQARGNTPCVLFFDEVDALGASRSDMRHSAGRQLINQFLSELDGVQASNDGVLILAATNAPWHLDTAFRRPGRFDRILFVPPPDVAGPRRDPADSLAQQARARRSTSSIWPRRPITSRGPI